MKAGEQVRTVNGRRGVVIRVEGVWFDVVFPEGQEQLHRDDLVPVAEDPAEALAGGERGDATAFGLRLQSLYLQHAYRFDPRSGLSNARVEPKLHQVYIAHRVATKLQPRMILADEVGLGKTIEAGLILKELRARGMVDRVLVIVPASLQYQWQTELRSKFNEDFEIVTSDAAKYLGQGGANPFEKRDNVICSLPFAANPKHAEQIVAADWDLVIFDEAHRVRRWLQGGRKETTTQAYRLADDLKELADGLLLLTATPMQLHPYELYSLIELVEPGLYPTYEEYEQGGRGLPALNDLMRSLKSWRALDGGERDEVIDKHGAVLHSICGRVPKPADLDGGTVGELMDRLVDKHPLASVMVRNRKAELGGFAGRTASRVLVELSPEEQQLYEEVATYLRQSYDRAVVAKQHAIGFLMVTYHKMLASSSYAIHQSLKRRAVKLRKRIAKHDETARSVSQATLEEWKDAPEQSQVVGDVEGLMFDRDEAMAELVELQYLIDRLGGVRDSKAERLLEALEDILTSHPGDKIVIFTQFLETQENLRAQLEHAGIKVAIFNGSLSIDEKEHAIRLFRGDAQVLISTEAGGEGRNLQFAHLLVNYDLPWNPMKVEQRIGRLDRIGQRQKVLVFNLACKGTVEERVLQVLDDRIRLFEESVGSLDPILGEVEDDIAKLVMGERDRLDDDFDAYEADLSKHIREAQEKERILADFVLDRASFRRDQANELLGERALASPRDLSRHVKATLDHYGGALKAHIDGGDVVTLSPRLSARLQTRHTQQRGVFDPEEALAHEDLDFYAFGHELIDRIVQLPQSLDPVRASAWRTNDVVGGPLVEVWWEVRGEGATSQGVVIRHRVDSAGAVQSDHVTRLPNIGEPAHDIAVPPWFDVAMDASRQAFRREQEEIRRRVREEVEQRRNEELGRAERIFSYRERRLRRRIEEDRAWITEKERTGSERDRRILPARRGKLAKDRERLERLEGEYERQVAEIRAKRPEVSGTLWGVALVVGR
jgi:SNF2 family DNA or RNA helicase